jgi:hypothetical protein
MKEFGEDGNHVANSTFWHARLPAWHNDQRRGQARLGIPGGPLFLGFGYCWMKTPERQFRAQDIDNTKIRII